MFPATQETEVSTTLVAESQSLKGQDEYEGSIREVSVGAVSGKGKALFYQAKVLLIILMIRAECT